MGGRPLVCVDMKLCGIDIDSILIKLIGQIWIFPGMNAVSYDRRCGVDILPKDLKHVDLTTLLRRILVTDHPQSNMISRRTDRFGPAFKIAILRCVNPLVGLCFTHNQAGCEVELAKSAANRPGE